MKIALIYPPFMRDNAFPLLSQNRQTKFSKSLEVRIFPLVMAYLATMLKKQGHEVLWLDAINARIQWDDYENRLRSFNPDWIVMETKTPLITMHWDYIPKLKKQTDARLILVGDHLWYKTEENFERSNPDYVIVGGDYDFIISELLEFETGSRSARPGGVYWFENNAMQTTGCAALYDLSTSPQIDRDLTQWYNYGEAYLQHPCAYILTGRGCGGRNPIDGSKAKKEKYGSTLAGRCTFCIWQHSFWRNTARMRPVKDVVDEIEMLYKKYGVVEVFDDNEDGPVWNKEWMRAFADEFESRGLYGKVAFSTNARGDNLDEEMCTLCERIGTRLLKIGVESGSNETLVRLQKDETIEEIIDGVKRAKRHGMVVLLTTMVGYPWETREGARKTWLATKEMMLYRTKFGDSLQSSVVLPYPGTPLYRYALRNDYFCIDAHNYDRFDQAEAVMKTDVDTTYWCRKMWRIMLHPLFIIKSFFTLRSWDDIKQALYGLRSLFGHLKDYDHTAQHTVADIKKDDQGNV